MKTTELLVTAFSLSLAITGFYIVVHWPGMILRPVKDLLDDHLPLLFRKPLYDCVICMASIWTLIYFASLGYRSLCFFQLCWLMLIVACLNAFVCIALNKLSDYGC